MKRTEQRNTGLRTLTLALLFASCAASRTSPAAPAPANPSAANAAVAASSAKWVAQSGWKSETPSSKMRVVQFLLERAPQDSQDASLVVFHFPNSGGSVEDNLQRWRGQFEAGDAAGGGAHAVEGQRTVGDFRLHEIDLSGRYIAEKSPGSTEHFDEPGWRMLAAVVEGPGGPFYVKLVGPNATVERWRASWNAFLSSIAG